MEPSSSASPEELARYARAGAAVGARVEAEARRLDAALAPFLARCSEYRVPAAAGLPPRLAVYGHAEADLAAWTGEVARGFLLADRGAAPIGLLPQPGRRSAAAARQAAMWNAEARRMISLSARLRSLIALRGIAGVLQDPALLLIVAALGGAHGGYLTGLTLAGDAPRRSRRPAADAVEQSLQLFHGFWYESMAHLEPEQFRALSAELDALRLVVFSRLGIAQSAPRTLEQAEVLRDAGTGALAVTAGQAFPWSAACALDEDAPFRPGPADAQAGEHSGISYYPDEQVRLERLNGETGDYRISIAGLDPEKPAAPNNFEAVALTAQGVSAGNHYYEVVKARFLADLERLPPGSTLHLEGHSMGGGMCFLLRDDPEVRQAIAAAGVTVGSLITFGAVRPRGPAGRARDDEASPFAGAEERHYVNADDSLALNVGAGHAGDPTVILLDNRRIDEPSAAHTAYGDVESYAGLPPELLVMPYLVDPATYAAYSPEPPAPADEPIAAGEPNPVRSAHATP